MNIAVPATNSSASLNRSGFINSSLRIGNPRLRKHLSMTSSRVEAQRGDQVNS